MNREIPLVYIKDEIKAVVIDTLIRDCGAIAERKGFHTAINSFCNGQIHSSTVLRLMLIHSEVSEALDCIRDDMPIDEELADIVIRVFDLAQVLNVPLGKCIIAKMRRNERRPVKHGHKNF